MRSNCFHTILDTTTTDALKQRSHHPLLVISNFIVQFLQIHPFQDGNGRLSRVLTNLLLMQAGYVYMPYVSHEKLIEDNKPNYYMSLRSSQKTLRTDRENIFPWLEFFLQVVFEQSRQAIALLEGERVEKLLSPIQLKIWEYMQQVGEATPKELADTLSVNRTTVNQVLNKLMALQKIERMGMGRATRYRLVSNR